MSVLNTHLHIGSFNLNIKIYKDIKTNETNLGRKYEHEKRINHTIEKIKDAQSNYNFFNTLF